MKENRDKQKGLKIISFDNARRTIKVAPHKYFEEHCKHLKLFVSEEKNQILCGDCNTELNPIWVLTRYAHEESKFKYEWERYSKIIELYDKKKRTKCEHCNCMTKVRV